jgi:hypothetical protein
MAKTPTSRSRITNGTKLLPDVDGRLLWARRYRDVYAALVADAGGDDMVSEAAKAIMRRAATLATELERREAAFATAGCASGDDLDMFARVSGTLARLLERVGIERKPRDITPSLESYMAAKSAAKVTAPPVPALSLLDTK